LVRVVVVVVGLKMLLEEIDLVVAAAVAVGI
jgi:hypothetical protein